MSKVRSKERWLAPAGHGPSLARWQERRPWSAGSAGHATRPGRSGPAPRGEGRADAERRRTQPDARRRVRPGTAPLPGTGVVIQVIPPTSAPMSGCAARGSSSPTSRTTRRWPIRTRPCGACRRPRLQRPRRPQARHLPDRLAGLHGHRQGRAPPLTRAAPGCYQRLIRRPRAAPAAHARAQPIRIARPPPRRSGQVALARPPGWSGNGRGRAGTGRGWRRPARGGS